MHGYNGPELHNSNQGSFPKREDEYSENLSMLICKDIVKERYEIVLPNLQIYF